MFIKNAETVWFIRPLDRLVWSFPCLKCSNYFETVISSIVTLVTDELPTLTLTKPIWNYRRHSNLNFVFIHIVNGSVIPNRQCSVLSKQNVRCLLMETVVRGFYCWFRANCFWFMLRQRHVDFFVCVESRSANNSGFSEVSNMFAVNIQDIFFEIRVPAFEKGSFKIVSCKIYTKSQSLSIPRSLFLRWIVVLFVLPPNAVQPLGSLIQAFRFQPVSPM